jgi:paraquat-inducible protein B
MKRQTADLVRALTAVTKHVPRVSAELLAGTMPADKQRELAKLFDGLASLLASHADDQEPKTPEALADRLAQTGRELLQAAVQLEADALTGSELQQVSGLLRALAEVLDLYGGKLPAPPAAAGPPDAPESPGP